MIRLAILLVLLTAAELGDGYIVKDPDPVVVCEMGAVYVREGR